MASAFVNDEMVDMQLTLADAVAGVSQSFRALSQGHAYNTVRQRDSCNHSVLNIMWAFAPLLGLMGVKNYLTIGKGKTHGSDLRLLIYSMLGSSL